MEQQRQAALFTRNQGHAESRQQETKVETHSIDSMCLPQGTIYLADGAAEGCGVWNRRKPPLELFEARNAVRIARAAKADQYAASTFAKAEQDLKQAEDYYRRKQGKTPIGRVAREAAQTAEEARVMSLKRQEKKKSGSLDILHKFGIKKHVKATEYHAFRRMAEQQTNFILPHRGLSGQ
jgi:hypothetical protein